MDNLVVVCADVGSIPKKNFGWWASDEHYGKDLSSLAGFVAQSLNDGRKVALGFECPLFVLLHEDEASLTRARPGEGNRAWCAGAGCGALATGLVQLAWVLSAIRQAILVPVEPYLSWSSFERAAHGLLLWEAFVSGPGKIVSTDNLDVHVVDARAGAQAFVCALPEPTRANAIDADVTNVYSLAGAALLRAGWSAEPALLSQPCLVLRATAPQA